MKPRFWAQPLFASVPTAIRSQAHKKYFFRGSESTGMALVVALALIEFLLALNAPAVQGQVCPASCGALSIPFPFGLSPACGVPELQLNCSGEMLWLQTPTDSYQVLNLTGRNLVINTTDFKASSCDGPNGLAAFILPENSSFALSENNRFFVNGCNAAGNVTTDKSAASPECRTGCENDKPQYPFCNIYSCCVTPIPTGSRRVIIRGGGPGYKAGSSCSFSSMVFPPSYVTEDQYVLGSGTYGVELSFAAPGNCSGTTLCSENATCVDVPTIPGHLCACPLGLLGDGYVNGTGCVAVDYCLESGRYCHRDARCKVGPVNMISCHCKSGFVGDGKVDGSGCTSVGSHVPVILGSLAAVSTVICASLIFSCLVLKRRDRKKMEQTKLSNKFLTMKRFQSVLSTTNGKEHASLFTCKDLERATKGFSADLKLGFGGFGTVYKGTLDDNTLVAIKRANHAGAQGSAQFLNEVTILSQVNHRNLVKLLGCCIDTEVPLLVYEYVPNGTLFEHLQGLRDRILSWEERLRIALETAEALAYLHSAAVPPIYHRDVKSTNILLDENLTAKVADFGISKLVPVTATHVSTAVQGTPGYLDPEYYQNYQLTDKTDVYSFGVVLLEIITGQKPVDFSRQSRDINLAAFTMPLIKKDLVDEIIDKRAKVPDEETATRINKVAKLAVQCLAFYRDDRPGMKQVVEELVKTRGSVTRVGGRGSRDRDIKSVESEYLVDGMRNISDLFPVSFSIPEWTSSSCNNSSKSDSTLLPAHESS